MAGLNMKLNGGRGCPSFTTKMHASAIGRKGVSLKIRAGDGGGPDLSVKVNGLEMPNPFVIGSGPPGTNYTVMKKAFDEGWGAVIAKTVSLDSSKVINVTPRYARLRAGSNGSAKGEVIGWQNIELISDRPLETMLKEFKQLKKEYPDRILIASIMEEYDKAAWQELIERVEETGVDALEINFSCPHGMPERKMGAAVGQDCGLLEEVCGWINEKATVPVWAKMTPNITDITEVFFYFAHSELSTHGKNHRVEDYIFFFLTELVSVDLYAILFFTLERESACADLKTLHILFNSLEGVGQIMQKQLNKNTYNNTHQITEYPENQEIATSEV